MNRLFARPFCHGLAVAALLVACSAPQVAPPPPPAPPPVDPWGARPQVDAAIRAEFPQAAVRALAAPSGAPGVEIQVVSRRQAPAVFLRWVLAGGVAHELAPGGKARRWPEGTMALAAEALTMGTRSHPGTGLAEALARHGGSLSVSALPDGTVIEGQVLSHQLAPFLRLIREVVTEPSLEPAAVDSLRRRVRARLENEQAEAETVAGRTAARLAHGEGHPYGSPGPTLDSIDQIQRSHLQQAARTAFSLAGSTLVAVGDVEPEAFSQLVRDVFGPVLVAGAPAPALPLPQPVSPSACHVIDVPDAVQTAIAVVNPGPPRRLDDWPALQVANQILGGSASSRLFTELRERKGLTYGAYSGFVGRRVAGRFEASTSVRTEVTDAALAALEAELARMRAAAPAEAELVAARRYLAGQFALSLAEGDQVADWLAAVPLYDLATETHTRYLERVQAVTRADVLRLAQAWIGVEPRATVLVGQLAGLRPAADAACPRLVQRDTRGRQVAVLVGSDAEMTDAHRATAFGLWPRSAAGLVALGRFVADAGRSGTYRAQALAAAAPTETGTQALGLGRQAADWPRVAAELRPMLLRLLVAADAPAGRGPRAKGAPPPGLDVAAASHVRAVLLAMATDVGPDGQLRDGDSEAAAVVRKAVAAWALTGIDATTPGEDVRARIEARLAPGDLQRLGDAAVEVYEHVIAADARRHEAARALSALGTPAANTALVQGYRRLYGRGVLPDAQDLALLAGAQGVEPLQLLFDVHALLQRSDEPAHKAATAATMATLRQRLATLAEARTVDPERTDLAVLFDGIEAHVGRLLHLRNGDDRWLAARLIVRHRGLGGVRQLLQLERYELTTLGTEDPKRHVIELARDEIAPFGAAQLQPFVMSALAGDQPLAKVVAVTVLKALGDEASLAALRTHDDDTDVAAWLGMPGSITVRDLALAAVDVRRYMREVDELVAAGRLDAATGERYKAIAFATFDLTDKRLRAEVLRQAGAAQGQPQ